MELEKTILYNLIGNEKYSRKVIPFLKKEYFTDRAQKLVFELIDEYYLKYSSNPSKDILLIDIQKKEVSQDTFDSAIKILHEFKIDNLDENWLIDSTEDFCKKKAIHNAILTSIDLYDKQNNLESIPTILSDAIATSFDNSIGNDFIEDYTSRFEKYHENLNRIKFDLKYLNEITDGGIPSKTLTVLMAGPGVGKSLAMGHMAAYNLMCGYNVLYITLELAEEVLAQRIESNLMNIEMNQIRKMDRETYTSRMEKIKSKSHGRLIIKEYPTASASALTFKHLIEELKIKKKFIPQIIYVDYLNICASARFRSNSGNVNSYSYVKAIAEELRGLAVQFDVPLITATQVNRCLDLNSEVIEKNRGKIYIKDIKEGDYLLSNNGYNKVNHIYDIEEQEVFEIKLKSGKSIICSDKHLFPTKNGNKSIDQGLKVGNKLFVLLKLGTSVFLDEDEIISINPLGKRKTIDITTNGNNLFFANGILTHNSGHSSSDFGMEDTSESFGLPMTADLFLALIQPEELAELNQIIFKQLKNRLNDLNYNKRFIIGVDKSRMKLYDVETSEQTKIKPEVSMIPDKKAKFANFK